MAKEIKNVALVGLGALGVLFGDHLVQKIGKENVRVIADQARIDRYQRDGVYYNGRACDFHYVTPEAETGPADLVLVGVKYNDLPAAIDAIANQVGPDTTIISMMNGIDSEEIIGARYGMDKMLYCVAQGMVAVKVGNQLTCTQRGMLAIGDLVEGPMSDRLESLRDFFVLTEFPHLVEDRMLHRLWGKYMMNVGANQVSAAFNVPFGDLQANGPFRDLMIAAMDEVIVMSQYAEVQLQKEDLDYWLEVLGTLEADGKSSMLQDVEAQRPSEIDMFAGHLMKLAEKYQIEVPVNQELYDTIKEKEANYVDGIKH